MYYKVPQQIVAKLFAYFKEEKNLPNISWSEIQIICSNFLPLENVEQDNKNDKKGISNAEKMKNGKS
ncbi:MAG: hypothetical protein PVJ67_03775 [Candidatus Pacearchaeota archaeon]|jgi:hypothetical protein